MATISSPGLGSGLDINALVSQLVAAERSPKERRLTQTDAKLTTEFTALAALKGALSSLRGASSALKGPDAFALRRTAVGDDQYFAASATGTAIAGSYGVQVQQLATAARLGSAAHAAGADAVVGTGTLAIGAGTNSFNVTITEANHSLAGIRDAINSAEGNTSVRATLIRDSAGTYLVLAGTATGADNALSITATDADAGLQLLADELTAFDPARDVAAQDAIALVSGYEVRSASNTLADAIEGVTLTLKKVTPEAEVVALAVQSDDGAIQRKAESFVSAYNALVQQITTLSRYDAATRTAGPMLGDSLLRNVDTQLRRILSDPVAGTSGAYRTLTSLGMEVTAGGTLRLDAAKFQKALAADPDALQRVFSSESGVAVRTAQFLDERLSATGEFSARDERITSQRRRLEQEKVALDARMVVVQQRYMRQFTAMDTMLAQLQTTSGYLAQQLEGLSKLSGSK